MKRFWISLFLLVAGCGSPKPPPAPPEPPRDLIRIQSGPTDPDAPTEFTTTESGLKYRILRKSDGKKPNQNSVIRFHYRGQLENGTIFASSYGKMGQLAQSPVKALVPGFAEGVQLIGEGGMIELSMPAELGYGAQSVGDVPSNAPLHFLVEITEISPD